jgi:hypothetical protein
VSLRTSVLALIAATVAIAASSALAGGAVPPKITSTLDGQKVLPLRTRWIVHPQIAAAKVKEVDYLIDGKVRWVEHSAPYVYGSDHNGRDLGFLITTWLTPGRHTFTGKVMTTDGSSATDTIVARVLPAPPPPAELAGTWTRTMTPADQKKSDPKFGRDNVPPAGAWTLVFDQVGAWELDPVKTGLVTQYDVAGDVIHAYAPISMAPCSDSSCGVSRYGHHHIGGQDCTAAGPFGSYRWSVSGSELTLTAVRELCGQRRAVWEGTWTRVG